MRDGLFDMYHDHNEQPDRDSSVPDADHDDIITGHDDVHDVIDDDDQVQPLAHDEYADYLRTVHGRTLPALSTVYRLPVDEDEGLVCPFLYI